MTEVKGPKEAAICHTWCPVPFKFSSHPCGGSIGKQDRQVPPGSWNMTEHEAHWVCAVYLILFPKGEALSLPLPRNDSQYLPLLHFHQERPGILSYISAESPSLPPPSKSHTPRNFSLTHPGIQAKNQAPALCVGF